MSEQNEFVKNVRAKVQELSRKARETQGKAVNFVDNTSRTQAVTVAEGLRKVAKKLDDFGHKAGSVSSSPDVR